MGKKDLSTKCQGYISRRSLGDKKDKKDKKMGKKSKKDKKSRRLGAKAVLLTVAKKCMDGNNVPGAAQGIVNGAINSLPISRRLGDKKDKKDKKMGKKDKKDKKRSLGALQKAACDAMVSSACGAAGVPPAVCNCFKKDLSTKCQGYISRRLGDKKDKKDKKFGKKDKKDKKRVRMF